ncbi:YwmB family TATA-box binding protein [Paenibacillus thiaminolyticus]|nr:YwmB family TATA-box binding protein [Paenibacillus thiaminolyticus]
MRLVRRTKTPVIGLLLLALCGAVAVAWSSDAWKPAPSAIAPASSEVAKRLHMLWVLAELSGERKFSSTITVQGSFLAEEGLAAEIDRWRREAGIVSALEPRQERGRKVYRGTYNTAPYQGDVLLFQENDGRIYYTVKLSAEAKGGMARSAEEAERLLRQLGEAKMGTDWNATVRAATGATLTDGFAAAEKALAEWGTAVPLDRYEDDRTISVTYETDYMGAGVAMKGRQANLQVAAHEDRERGETRLSFGTPLIAGEY